MEPGVQDVIARIPQWAGRQDIKMEPAGGVTNKNYRVSVGNERYVLRVGGRNAPLLGIDRAVEREALAIAEQSGIGAKVEAYFLPEGHLVTRWIEARHWNSNEYRRPGNLARVVDTVKSIHAFPAISGSYSPFQRVRSYASQARAFGVPFPDDFSTFERKMEEIERFQQQDTDPWLRFCHNDLFSVNFMDDGQRIRVVDWEFAGMGDLYYDLAALVYAYDSDGPLPLDLEETLLWNYFGEVTDHHRQRLAGMKYMLLFFTAMWGLLQHGAQKNGISEPYEDFDPLDYALETFETLRGLG